MWRQTWVHLLPSCVPGPLATLATLKQTKTAILYTQDPICNDWTWKKAWEAQHSVTELLCFAGNTLANWTDHRILTAEDLSFHQELFCDLFFFGHIGGKTDI